jgi:EmrB/QacA subfamily drug resistance transporter
MSDTDAPLTTTASSPPTVESDPIAGQAAGRNLAIALAVIAGTQLMVSLDDTIVNIALPAIQKALGIAAPNLTWIVTAYALTFGGLLLLGGRSSDLFGRVRMFRVGILVFALASLAGGLAQNEAWLIGARAVQGVGAAIAAPTALSLIYTTFVTPEDRNKAMGAYGGMGGLGSTLGLLLGGLLTEYLDWRWVMFVNVPIAVLILVGSRNLVEGERLRGRLDVLGAILGTLGVAGLVFAFNRGGEDGFGDSTVVTFLIASIVLLAAFLLRQARTAHPVLPLRLLADGTRAGALIGTLLVYGGMFATYYFLTLFMQQVLGYSAWQTGLAYLPFSFGMALAAGGLAPKLLQSLSPRVVIAAGLLVATLGMVWFSTLDRDSSFVGLLLPGMIITSLGLGLTFVPLTVSGVATAPMQDMGAVSGVLSTAQQIGVALGLAILPTIALSVADGQVDNANDTLLGALSSGDQALAGRAAEALTDGYSAGFLTGAGLFVLGLVLVLLLVRPPAQRSEEASRP